MLKVQCRSLSKDRLKSFRIQRCSYGLRKPYNTASWSKPPPWLLCQRRETSSKATVTVQDLPQRSVENGLAIQGEELDSLVYPTVIQQAWNNMRKFEDCVLLTRMGGFYEVSWRLVDPIASTYAISVVLRTRRRIWALVESQGCSKENDCRTSCYGKLALQEVP